jgi:hypothetical protein
MKGQLNPRYGYKYTKEEKDKMSRACQNKIISDECKKKMSLAGKGKTLSSEHKQKIGIANKGKSKPPLSKEHKEKICKNLIHDGNLGKNYYNDGIKTYCLFSTSEKIKQLNLNKGRIITWNFRKPKKKLLF